MKMLQYLFVLSSAVASAQTIDYNKIVLPQSAQTDVNFEEKLVQLAWSNHPENRIVRKNVDIATYNRKLSRRQWYDIFNAQGNINEFNIDPSRDIQDRANFFPRYNVSARFSLGMIFSIPIENKIRTESVTIAQEEVNARMLQVRQAVLQSYNTYLMYKEIYSIQSLGLSDAESNKKVAEQAFESGEMSFDRYINSMKAFDQIKIAKIRAERDFLNAKLALESLVGVRLEDIQ